MQADTQVKGRPKRDREATRQRLLDAARDLFGEHGYDGVTVRMIAAAAEANMALVNRYFGSKAALFAEVLEGESSLRGVIAAEDGGPLHRRLAEHFVRQLHRGPTTLLTRIIDRSAGNPEVKEILREHMERVLVEPLTEHLGGPDARPRALLAATIIMGGGPMRRMFGGSELRGTDPEELTLRLTGMFECALAPSPPVPPKV